MSGGGRPFVTFDWQKRSAVQKVEIYGNLVFKHFGRHAAFNTEIDAARLVASRHSYRKDEQRIAAARPSAMLSGDHFAEVSRGNGLPAVQQLNDVQRGLALGQFPCEVQSSTAFGGFRSWICIGS